MSKEKFYSDIKDLLHRYHSELPITSILEDTDLSTLIDSFVFARILMHIEELRGTLINFDAYDWRSAYSLKTLYTLYLQEE